MKENVEFIQSNRQMDWAYICTTTLWF